MQKIQEILSNKTKWKILKELAEGEKSASEIARKTKQSTANTTHQLQLLEAHELIRKIKPETHRKKPGKPKTPYALNQEIISLTLLKKGVAEKKTLKLKDTDNFENFLINAIRLITPKELYYLTKYICETNLIEKADAIGLLKTEDKKDEQEIELMIITEHTEEIRQNYSNMEIKGPNKKTKKVISWSHNKKEIQEGLERKEKYFEDLVKKSHALIDKNGELGKLKELV